MPLAISNIFTEIYQYREVLYSILSRELKVKYKRTYLGYLWSLLNPVLQMAVLAAVFSHIVNKGVKDYTLYLFSGLLAWNFFSTTVQTSSRSLLENENFIKKIYLPKVLFPLSKLCMRWIEFIFSLVALSLIGLVIGMKVKATVLLLPFAMISLSTFTLGLSLIAAIATVYFRDV
jgi:ABC-type polysaccharide/polyol phosphate export permease